MLRTAVKTLKKESPVNIKKCEPTKELQCTKLKLNEPCKTEDKELIITVYDETENLKSDFEIPQQLLTSKVGYFAKEVNNCNCLENLHISVHCNIYMFEWIICWAHCDPSKPETFPVISNKIIIPLLNCAINLSIKLLIDYLFIYVKNNINNVILSESATSFKCKELSIKLCKYFSNIEIDSVKDKKDKIKSNLYCEFIKSLADHVVMYKQGHFSSLLNIFQCGFCGKILASHLSYCVPCITGRNFIDSRGNLQSSHVMSKKWCLSKYIKTLFSKLKSWRLVYWRLWGDCHFLCCSSCNLWYPLSQAQWCSYHPGNVKYMPMFNKELYSPLEYPVSCYDCCGQKVFKFDVLQFQNGCVYRPHKPVLNSPLDRSIYKIFKEKFHLISLRSPKYNFSVIHHMLGNNSDLSNATHLLYRLKPVPSLCIPDSLVVDSKYTRFVKKSCSIAFPLDQCKTNITVKKPVGYGEIKCDPSSFVTTFLQKKKKSLFLAKKVTQENKRKENKVSTVKEMKLEHGYENQLLWYDSITAMINQDNQRSYEEYYMKRFVSFLLHYNQFIPVKHIKKKRNPSGGLYVCMEREWFFKNKNYLKQKYGINSFAKYHIYNLPWSRFVR